MGSPITILPQKQVIEIRGLYILQVSCSRKCQHGMKCYHDYGRRRCESRCEPPYTGIYCNQPQGSILSVSHIFFVRVATFFLNSEEYNLKHQQPRAIPDPPHPHEIGVTSCT